jgi:hypothetical protein
MRDQVDYSKLDAAVAKEVRRGRKSLWKFAEPEWTDTECVVAGNWMLECAERLDYFTIDDRGFLPSRRVGKPTSTKSAKSCCGAIRCSCRT